MTHVIQSHPAVDYVQGNGVYSTGDYFALPFETARYGTMYHKFRCGTIAGLAAQDGEDVDAAIRPLLAAARPRTTMADIN